LKYTPRLIDAGEIFLREVIPAALPIGQAHAVTDI
jgi:hypothetical protein